MRKFVLAVVAVLACGSLAQASEPSLADFGLGGLVKVSDEAGKEVRGLAAQASGLSNLAAIMYDTTTGSKANIDLVNFSLGQDDAASVAGGVAQNMNQIGVAGTLTVTFPGTTTASIGAFSAGGVSQGLLNQNNIAQITFTTPVDATP